MPLPSKSDTSTNEVRITMKHRLNTDEDLEFEHKEITKEIIGAAFEVYNILGYGFLEKIYQKALQVELKIRGLETELEPQLKVNFKGYNVGDYYADLLVNKSVVVEIKTHQEYNNKDEAQLLNELKSGEVKIGLLINFSREKVEFKRLIIQ